MRSSARRARRAPSPSSTGKATAPTRNGAVEAFKQKTGIEVVHDYYNAESEMLTKLRTNPGAYDVVVVNSARTQQATAEDLLDAVDFSKVPNTAGVPAKLSDNPNFTEDGKHYGVPWVWGMNALAVRDGRPKPDSYGALADPPMPARSASLTTR